MAEPSTPGWVTVLVSVVAGGGLATLLALLRTFMFRRPEARKMIADAAVLETQVLTAKDTSEFGRVSQLLDRYEKRQATLEARLDAAETQLAALREEVAELRPRAKYAVLLEEEVKELRTRADLAEASLEDSATTIEELRERIESMRKKST